MMSRNLIFRICYVLTLIILICIYFRQCEKVKTLKEDLKRVSLKTDTVHISKIFEIPKPYPEYLKPEVIKIYLRDTIIKWDNISLTGKDVVLSTTSNKDSILINNLFLSTYPFNEKLLYLGLMKNQLTLSLLDIGGDTKSYLYTIDLESYAYSYSYQNMSYKKIKKLHIKPFVEYSYRPLNNFQDLELGLNLKTKVINYKLGLSGFYYPSIQKNPGWDLKFSIIYNF